MAAQMRSEKEAASVCVSPPRRVCVRYVGVVSGAGPPRAPLHPRPSRRGWGGALRPWCQAQHALTSHGQAGARPGEARRPEGGSTGLWERRGAREVSGGDWRDQGGKLRGRGTRGAQALGDRGRGARGRSGDQQGSAGRGTKPAKTKSYRPSCEEGESGTGAWRSRWGTRMRNLAPS